MIWGTGIWGTGKWGDESSSYSLESPVAADFIDESWGFGASGFGDDWGDTLVVDPAYADESPTTVPFTEE